jgi:hypothetical protein
MSDEKGHVLVVLHKDKTISRYDASTVEGWEPPAP